MLVGLSDSYRNTLSRTHFRWWAEAVHAPRAGHPERWRADAPRPAPDTGFLRWPVDLPGCHVGARSDERVWCLAPGVRLPLASQAQAGGPQALCTMAERG